MSSMSTSTARRKAASSPSSTSNSPSLTNASLPRLKLSLRNNPSSSSSSSRNRTGTGSRTRTSHSNQRKNILSDSDSELTPADDDDDDEDEDDTEDDKEGDGMDVDHELDMDDGVDDVADTFAPRTKNSKGKVDATPRTKTPHSHSHITPTSQKPHTTMSTPLGSASKQAMQPPAVAAASGSGSGRNITTTGPQGRHRKRAIKVGDLERRRARDAKFDVNSGDAFAFTPTRQRRSPPHPFDTDSESSYGDDESDPEPFHTGLPFGMEREDDDVAGLPQAFAGQEIEDLAYGGGPVENDMERHVLSGLWEDDDDDEDEELFISQLSGSEAELQSQSSVHESDSAESSSDESTDDDEVDEFGYPLPSTASAGSEEGPLVLMENWDGQFVLVQPRQDRSRSRRRGSRGSRTAGSAGGSTVLSAQDQQALLVDADADYASSSEWSGMSDEDGDGGDTTDSMAEEDMPMLDSPALDQIIGEQIGHVEFGVSGSDSGPEPEILTPSIVVTDAGVDPIIVAALPTPPGPSTPMAPPQMGTFHPTTDDPAQHAVIDGSKVPTKSPFTHRRRSRRGRASSVATTTRSMDQSVERKRKTSTSMPPSDPFFPTTLPKRARYSSIPGHPRYVAARRAAHAQAMAIMEQETTSDEAEGLDLEDMLETELLSQSEAAHAHAAHDHPHSSGFRFDRVPVSTYLRRNFGSSARREEDIMPFSSPLGRSGGDVAFDGFMGPGMSTLVGVDAYGLGDTLAGPPARMMLVSPGLNALDRERREGGDNLLSRKEKRRRRRLDTVPLAAPSELSI